MGHPKGSTVTFVGAQRGRVHYDIGPVELLPDGEYAIPEGCILEIGVFPGH